MYIYLDDKTVILHTESGLAKYEFRSTDEARRLFELFILSEVIEKEIAELSFHSL